MTFAVLRNLHAIIGDALDEMEGVYSSHGYSIPHLSASGRTPGKNSCMHDESSSSKSPTAVKEHKSPRSTSDPYVSPPPSPSVATWPDSEVAGSPKLDFPSLDSMYDQTSLSEALTSHPTVIAAIGRIIAAAGQLSASVQTPFLTLCDAAMGYHLPSCMRLLEASHVVEILREAGPSHVEAISERNGVNPKKLAHVLRLLATHHILRELSPDVFTLNRISSLVDSGKSFSEIQSFQVDGWPELKYQDTNGIAAFVGLCTDELQKSAAYMTETYYLSPSKQTRDGTDPASAPFCFAFDTVKSKTGFFGWLEGEIHMESDEGDNGGGKKQKRIPRAPGQGQSTGIDVPQTSGDVKGSGSKRLCLNPNRFRLERFGKAMSGTDGWESPGAVLNGFDWHSLAPGSIIVDVGGGIGSTSMLLATAFSSSSGDGESLNLRFIIQDRAVVCEMGEKAWKAKCPELLESKASFQAHDFFTPQPVKNASIFLLRVVLHDWPDAFARKILLHLREAATPSTQLLIADFILPLACPDSMIGLEDVEGAENLLAPPPLLPNLGKASANVYWMDLTMQVIFNAQERTLREILALAASAGWKVVKVTRTTGSLFGYMVAIPAVIPEKKYSGDPSTPDISDSSARVTPTNDEAVIGYPKSEGLNLKRNERMKRSELKVIERASSRCGTPTFGSNMRLSSVQEALTRFGGGIARRREMTGTSRPSSAPKEPPPVPLKPALLLSGNGGKAKKAKPSKLSIIPSQGSPTSPGPSSPMIQTPSSATIPLVGGMLSAASASGHGQSHSPSQSGRLQSSNSPGPKRSLPRRLSLANLRPTTSHSQEPPLPLPTLTVAGHPPPSPLSPRNPNSITPVPPSPARMPTRRVSQAQLSSSANVRPSHLHGGVQAQGMLSPSSIPVRTIVAQGSETNTISLSPSRSGPGATTSPDSSLAPPPLVMTQRTISRRLSYAQLPQVTLRKRSGTVVGGPSANPNFTVGGASPPSRNQNESSRMSGFGNVTADPKPPFEHGHGQPTAVFSFPPEACRTSSDETSAYVPEFERGSVLAAAARIEKGDFATGWKKGKDDGVRSTPPEGVH